MNRIQVQVGTLTYDDVSRKITWTIPAVGNTLGIGIQAFFDIAVVPRDADAGAPLTILNATDVSATDTITHSPLSLAVPQVTTDLQNDTFAKGKGIVK